MTANHLERARALPLPTREAMLHRAPSVQAFWLDNKSLLANAWQDCEALLPESITLDESLIDSRLREAISLAWDTPETENAVRDLWEEVAPGVYQCQFFDVDKLAALSDYFDKVADAQIPLRPPYGIVLNRRGMMLDKRSEGYLATPEFQQFYRVLIDTYMRPISRLLFPEITGHDTQSFGFSIAYQPSTDTSIRPHTDASAVTLNINMNKPSERFSGSTVDFYDSETGQTQALTFKPGVAVIHRGNVPHAAQPITSGERANMVLWLYGERGFVPHFEPAQKEIDAKTRWTVPSTPLDTFAPF